MGVPRCVVVAVLTCLVLIHVYMARCDATPYETHEILMWEQRNLWTRKEARERESDIGDSPGNDSFVSGNGQCGCSDRQGMREEKSGSG